MKSDINDLCEAFLAALTNAGYAVKSIENYKQVSNRFKKFCAENGYDTYTVNIGQIFADNVFNEETGAFVGYRNVMYGRFVRLINSFYLQGTFDFSMVTKEKNLPKSIHLIEIYQDYMEHLKTQYSNIGTIGFFQNGMLHLLRYMEDGGILTLKDLAVSDVVNYICSWSQKHQRNVLCILRNIFRHFGREDLYFAVAGIHPYRTKRIVPMFTDNEIMSIEEVLSSPSVSHRDAAIFFLGLTTGMRAVDVVDLRLANIDWDNETIFFQQSKTGNAVCLPLTVDIGNSIYRYILEERPRVDDDHVFLNTLFPRTLSDQKFTCCPTSRYNDFLKNVTHTCSERKHQGVLMFIRPCTVFSIAAVRGVVKPDISVVKMSTLVTVIWISYNQKDIETVGYFYRMS